MEFPPGTPKGAAVQRFLAVSVAVVIALTLAPAPAHADTPVTAPSQLEAVHVSDTGADLWWNRNGAAAYDVAEVLTGGQWYEYRRNLTGALALTGLTPGVTYTFRVYSVPKPGLDLANSEPSAPVTFTTLPGPDTQPPSTPAAPTFSAVTPTSFTVSWAAATDNVQVTGYQLQRLFGTTWATVATVAPGSRAYAFSGQTPATAYTFAVIAVDARNNRSPRSSAATVTTPGALTCQVALNTSLPTIAVTFVVQNTTPDPVTPWSVQFTLPLTISISGAYNATATRVGTAATLTPAPGLTTIAPSGGVAVVSVGLYTVTPYTPPSNFSVNGIACR